MECVSCIALLYSTLSPINNKTSTENKTNLRKIRGQNITKCEVNLCLWIFLFLCHLAAKMKNFNTLTIKA